MRPLGALSKRWTAVSAALMMMCCTIPPVVSVKEHDFKKCHQSGFCKRNREYADRAVSEASNWISPYDILPDSAYFSDGRLEALILKHIDDAQEAVRFPLTVTFLESGTARVSIDEEQRRSGDIRLRHDSPVRKERYNEVEKHTIVGGLGIAKDAKLISKDGDQLTVQYGPDSRFEAVVYFSPFRMEFKRDGASHIKLNDRGMFNIEHWRPKVDKSFEENKENQQHVEDESTWWDETFGGNTDTKPRGPESVAIDISFVGYEHVYGIPEHTGPLSLRETRGGSNGEYAEPYRLYNTDVFEYALDSPMTLYGSIPFMKAHRKGSTAGVFCLNSAETWIDITKSSSRLPSLDNGSKTEARTHWISESGIFDVFVFLGPLPRDVSKQYTELTGTTAMPQEFSLGYHQCRWNYISDDDVKDVNRYFNKYNIPYDVIWLDIEYPVGKKWFTWDDDKFMDPIGMGKALDQYGRYLVAIIDPHIKNEDGYEIHEQITSKGLTILDKNSKPFEGWCWPGASHWIDCLNPKAVEWWKGLFPYKTFKGTMENTFIWNDMNEPSVFNGPEVTMPKDNIHYGGWEHRDIHNLHGMVVHNATYQALLSRKDNELRRPFVLTRSFYAGSQRLGASWTGDNEASWGHLAASTPMMLSQGIAGFPFTGADIGGYFGNPEPDLMARWYQAGAFHPFFRGHAHIDARRREPYLLAEPFRSIITVAIRLRYTLLPSWYTAFFHAYRDGSPIIRPMFWTHPEEVTGFAVDDQFFVGSTGLLHKPVVEKDKESVDILIPDDEVYYDYFTYEKLATQRGQHFTKDAALHQIPLVMRGGHIFARRDRPRRSSKLMRFDDYTLVVSISKDGKAEGELYVDDGDSFDYEKGQYIYRRFYLADDTLSSSDADDRDMKSFRAGSWLESMKEVLIDKIILVGTLNTPNTDIIMESGGRTWTVPIQHYTTTDGSTYAVVGRVGARIGDDWNMKFS
ncbi:Glucosidase 2 subunit alpha 2 [Colletotrichum chlorophyti]|uniref:alpha-glucosidase n=1 Tax=Colletotrichum chlorophyti TaxID=708187 RepID=A0A1Q8RZR4_9PEZI|nr:Glucosidase 2 subunit alpha 2 [Colletotrichum chlorophyti]